MIFAALVLAALLTAWCTWLSLRAHRCPARRRWARRLLTISCLLGAALTPVLAAGAAYAYWYTHRSPPAPQRRPLFVGVDYVRDVRQSPRPMVIHVVTIDLAAPGLAFLVTPRSETNGRVLKGRKTSTFLEEFGVQLAINANYFLPFRSESPWDYYPRAGDGVDLCGFAASRGDVYSNMRWRDGTLYLSKDNRASFDAPPDAADVYNAISGNGFILRQGEYRPPLDQDDPAIKPYPRAAVGLDASARRLILLVVDGKQPGYSEGATLVELAAIAREYGVQDLARLDEGGSCALPIEHRPGHAALLNVPINNRIPYRERAVANHLGVIARRLP